METKVAEALQTHGLPFLHMKTRSRSNGDELERFQNGCEEWVLILSLERAASGSNLTSANHVLFVHPMNATSVATAKAYEQQAVARVRRIGQSRPEIHVWRFVTRDTIEEHMHNLHTSEEAA